MNRLDENTILIVEDCDEDFDTDKEGLGRLGYPVRLVRALNGDDCLTLLRGGLRPLFVLLDLNTPGRDGREALYEIKTDPKLRQLPVVVLTTSANPRDLDACYAAGANAYHVKPLHFPDHLTLLQDIYRYWLTDALLPLPAGRKP